jgi:signal peptidase II
VNEKPCRLPLVAVGIAAAVADLVSKWWVFRTYDFLSDNPVVGNLVSIRPLYNQAGPWSWGHGFDVLRWVLPLVSLVAVGVIGRIWWQTDPRDRIKSLGLVLILGGAAGNLWDRVIFAFDGRFGVRDFVLVKGVWFGGDFPAFNLADTWITVGVVFVAWRLMFEMKPDPAGAPGVRA